MTPADGRSPRLHAREFPGGRAHRRHSFLLQLIALLAVASSTIAPHAAAQTKPPSDRVTISADQANTWSNGDVNVIQLSGNVSIQTDDARMTARQAVVWLAPVAGAIRGKTRLAQFQLIGDARLEHDGAVRSGPTLFVD